MLYTTMFGFEMTPEIRAVCAELTTVRQAISHLRHAAEAASLMRVIQRRNGAATSEEHP